jgi:hypothetical protein
VKTQRALNDYRKSAFPHYKDEITRLRYIGVVSANRLKDARAHLGQDVPVECVDTVQDLKKLVEYAETNRSAGRAGHGGMEHKGWGGGNPGMRGQLKWRARGKKNGMCCSLASSACGQRLSNCSGVAQTSQMKL